MKLTRQLALVSLAALILPWAALQSLFIFDTLLREGQSAALQATANAVAARLGGDNQLLERAGLGAGTATDASHELYLHSLPAPPQLDGSAADWSTYPLAPLELTSTNGPEVTFSAGQYGDKLYLLLQVADATRQFHRQSDTQLATGDHIALFIGNQQEGSARYYAIRAQLPGEVQALYRDSAGLAQRDYRIRGVWRETEQGYAVELTLPADWSQQYFALSAVDKSATQIHHTGTLGDIATMVGGPDPGVLPDTYGRLISHSPALNKALNAFSNNNLRLSVLDKHGWLRGQSGELTATASAQATPWYVRILNPRRTLPPWQDARSGQWPNVNEMHTHWYHQGSADIAQVSAPLYRDWPDAGAVESQKAGLVIVEQRINPWRMIDNRAALNLLGLTLGAGALLLALLIGYALWLSLRIRRLSRAALMVGDNRDALSQTLKHWPRYRVNDEVAELAGHYRRLLEQVRAHTDYLKTLTSKLAHELRTPLAVVNSSLDNLQHTQEQPHSASQAPYIERARQGTLRLSRLVSAMTEASRMETSIASAEREEIHLDQLLRDMSAAYRDAYPLYRFECEIQPVNDGGGQESAYKNAVAPELLVQLLDKLIDNAVSFSPREAPITLSLSRIYAEAGEPQLLLSVHNQGPPLPAELEGQLFNSLTSSRPQSGDKQLHLGLGLYIVDLIARYHEARIWAENTHEGVAFHLLLPIKSPELIAQRKEDS
ncbi:ATP-binding protein [Gilvimarinus chinensis]|uniref:ATP-binding protein n=1 Tax=Gilvimarinus chinensis TaxID=396005 RepID=UPI00036D5367|nr:ATP-binding protein [Gilvimarinus chinensis]